MPEINDYDAKITELIKILQSQGGSDLHLSVNRHPMIRVDGALVPLLKQPELTAKDTRGFMEVLVDDDQVDEFDQTKELDFSFSFEDTARFRCNCFYQRESVGIAMRLIPQNIRSLEELNLPSSLRQFSQKEQGFFLVVGPVGQGKTTTLASLIEIINQERSAHILTIENPIEYTYDQKKSIIDQREVEIDTHTFGNALKSMFRQDIDVVMIGEMRGNETISTAVTAAETGHLVFSTLHTNSSSQTIDRIIDSFPSSQQAQIRSQLASSLTGILSQRLIPATSSGQVPAYELLINNTAVSNLIRESRTHEIDSVIETSYEQGMVSMNRSLVELVRSGQITIENARRFSLNPSGLERMI